MLLENYLNFEEKLPCKLGYLQNDQILEKYFKAFKKEEAAICYITHLLAEGFDYSYYTGATEELINNQHIKIYFLYHYMFQIENKNLIKIRKR